MRFVSLLFATLLVTGVPAAQPAESAHAARASPASEAWVWPVSGPRVVLRAFVAPSTAYGPGHRGVDLNAPAHGDEVVAVMSGIVHFAGVVVDRPVITIRQGQVLATVEPVDPLVTAGDVVQAGDIIGVLQAGHCARPCVHLGVRVAGEYVSPLLWLGGLQRAVLLPMNDEASRGSASGARVCSAVGRRQSFGAHVRVDLRGSETRVAENLLHRTQVGPTVEQVRRGRVAQRVRTRRP